MSSKSSPAHVEDKSSSLIKRIAVDTSGCIGSLYDGDRHQMLGEITVKTVKSKVCNLKTARCEIINSKTTESQNLLQMIGIEDDLRLSILLNLAPRTGLAALIDHSYPINEHTRFLRYTYMDREENLPEDVKKARKQIKSPQMPQTDATHIITGVTWGIDVVIVLQLPSETELVHIIDTALEKIKTTLHDNHDSNTFDIHDLDKLNITNMKVYSNIPALTRATTLYDIYQRIHQFKSNYNDHRPVNYTFRSIQEFYPKNTGKNNTIAPLDASANNEVEQRFLQLSSSIKYLESSCNKNRSGILSQYCVGQLYDMYMRLLDVKKKYIDEVDRFGKLVVDWRHTRTDISEIRNALDDGEQTILRTTIDDLNRNLKELELKQILITGLQKQQFQYWNVAGCNLDESYDEKKVEKRLIKDYRLDRILCSNDILNQDKPSELNQQRELLVEEHQKNADLRLIYADFSNCTFPLSNMIILPRDKMNQTEDNNNHTTSSQSTEPQICAKPSSLPPDEVINMLLLGESGVGKSTFINAFVNYLTFKTLAQAESNKPVVLIPVSFLTTVGDDFKECMVKFGDSDRTNNEDFDHPGQSVTQRCKSYIFDLNGISGKKLRIIDTPGFGDTRGLDQDDLNMQHILEYINNLTHLNAVCFLLKPNVTRLNNYFRTCLTQLFDLLSPDARQNIIFCFTNARTTFYTPGDTASPLRNLLDSLPVSDIPFKKTNTFCFDNESFRYLVALQNSIRYSELDRNEYEKSWLTSATESNRLVDYVCNDQLPYNIRNKWRSTKHAQIKIVHMTRPILEAMRNTLRNIILLRMKLNNTSIQLIPKCIDGPTTICRSCKFKLIRVANFYIVSTDLHTCRNKCLMCPCAPDRHRSIDYTLRYEASNDTVNHVENEMVDQVSLLLNACVEFARFLKNTAYSPKKDLFLDGLGRMIQEEKHIRAEKESNESNTQLLEELEKLKNKYECRMREMKSNQNNIELPIIYERIKITRCYPGVHEQMNAAEKGQENMVKHSEYQVRNDSTNTSDCVNTVV